MVLCFWSGLPQRDNSITNTLSSCELWQFRFKQVFPTWKLPLPRSIKIFPQNFRLAILTASHFSIKESMLWHTGRTKDPTPCFFLRSFQSAKHFRGWKSISLMDDDGHLLFFFMQCPSVAAEGLKRNITESPWKAIRVGKKIYLKTTTVDPLLNHYKCITLVSWAVS